MGLSRRAFIADCVSAGIASAGFPLLTMAEPSATVTQDASSVALTDLPSRSAELHFLD